MVTAPMELKNACSLEESYDKPRQHIKKQRHYFANKYLSSQSLVFPVVMYGCDSWTIKKAERQRMSDWTELNWDGAGFSEAGYYVWDYNSKNSKNKGYSQSMESKLTLPSYRWAYSY